MFKFCRPFCKQFNKKVGLIPCADGGTTISQWQEGEVLFDHAVFMAKLAMRASKLGGILWHQGESDCNDINYPLYKERLIRMIFAIRKALGVGDIPFIFGEVSENISSKWNLGDYPKKMNALLKEIQEEVPNCRLVSANGLTLKPDGIHFNSVSLREFGNRYFDAYLDLVNAK